MLISQKGKDIHASYYTLITWYMDLINAWQVTVYLALYKIKPVIHTFPYQYKTSNYLLLRYESSGNSDKRVSFFVLNHVFMLFTCCSSFLILSYSFLSSFDNLALQTPHKKLQHAARRFVAFFCTDWM